MRVAGGDMNDLTIPGQRTITAPWYPGCDRTTGGMMNVTLAPDEDVEWTWSYGADGQRQVIGYTIIKKAHSSTR